MPRIAFGTGSYVSESRPAAAQRMQNCYLETNAPLAKTPIAVPRAAGVRSFASVAASGAFRGALTMAGVLYVVHASTLYRVTSAGASTAVGTIGGSGRVWMSTNGTQLSISTGSTMYVYDGTSTAEVSDPDFPGATWNYYLDGYTIFGEPDSGRFWITSINDSTMIDGLDFATAEAQPGNTVAAIVDHRELFLFSLEDYEVWYNSGNADFPFERTGSGIGEIGVAGPHAVGKKDNTVFILGSDGIGYRLEGYNPLRITNSGIEREFRIRTIAECVIETWTERGHAFVGYQFPDKAFIYDVGTQLWWEAETYQLGRWRRDFFVTAYGKTLVGCEGVIGELSPDVYADLDLPLIATCTAPPVAQGNAWIEHDRLELVFETGVGLNLGQGSAPIVMLRWSDDGGETFPFERTASLGAIGQNRTRVVFTRLGRSRDRVYEWSVSDPVKLWFLEALLNEHS